MTDLKKSLKGWFLGVFLCAFMSLAYGTVMYVWMMEHCDGESENFLLKDSHPPCKKKYGAVMYVWMMEHCDGEPHPWNSYSQTSPSLLQVKSRLSLAPVLTTTLASGVWWPPWLPTLSQIGEICRFYIQFSSFELSYLPNFPIIPQLIFSVPLVLLYSAYWVFPESSRWLLANGRVEEAEDIVREIARWVGSRFLPLLFIWDLNDLHRLVM